MSRELRKELVLARIRVRRLSLRHDLQQVRQAAQWRRLLGGVIGNALGTPAGAAGRSTGAAWSDTALAVMRLVRRFRLAAGVLAAATAGLRGPHRASRLVLLGVGVAAAFAAWWLRQDRRPKPPP